MISSLMILVGILTAALKVAEFVIDESAQQKIAILMVRIWSFLDNIIQQSYVRVLTRTRVRFAIVTVVVLNVNLFIVYISWDALNVLSDVYGFELMNKEVIGISLACFTVIILLNVILGNYFLAKIIKHADWKSVVRRTVFFVGLYFMTIFLVYILYTTIFVIHLPGLWDLLIAVPELLTGLISISVLCSAAIAIIPFACLAIVYGSLYISELVVRKITEFPKGPVLGLSAFLTVVGSLIKAL